MQIPLRSICTGYLRRWQIDFFDFPRNMDYYSYKKPHYGDGI